MHAESPFPSGFDAVAGDLDGLLRAVVSQIRAAAAPPELVARFLERAARWSVPEPVVVGGRPPRRGWRWALTAAAVLGFAAVVAGVIAYWFGRTGPSDPPAVVA